MFIRSLGVAFVAIPLALAACGAPAGSAPEDTGVSSAALTLPEGNATAAAGSFCWTDSDCASPLACDAYCPVIPGRSNCLIGGGRCEAACVRSAETLSGSTFTSADGLHSVAFTSSTAFTKTEACPTTGIHCEYTLIEHGTYSVSNATVTLTAPGNTVTLTVNPHCYDGLLNVGIGVELYPAAP